MQKTLFARAMPKYAELSCRERGTGPLIEEELSAVLVEKRTETLD